MGTGSVLDGFPDPSARSCRGRGRGRGRDAVTP